jgi:hypothetical protein
MPRKAAATGADAESAPEPRRSSRISSQPKPEPAPPKPKKAPAKPRAPKSKNGAEDKSEEAVDAPTDEAAVAAPPTDEKPKSARGKKRKADEVDGDAAATAKDGEEPPAKKVSHFFSP